MKKIIQVQFKDGDELRVSVDNSLLEEGDKDHCTGCTDPRSEGTHQMGTIEHLDITAPAEWEEEFGEMYGGFLFGPGINKAGYDKLKSFIRNTLAKEMEEL